MSLRVAVVTNFFPAPANSGSAIRAHRLASGLAKRGAVTLYCRSITGPVDQFRNHPDLAVYADVRAVELAPPAALVATHVFADGAVDLWTAPTDPLAEMLQEDHRRAPFDAVVAQQLFTVNVARSLGIPWVLDEHNIESGCLAVLSASGPPKRGGWVWANPDRVRTYAAHCWEAAPAVTCVSAADAATVSAHRVRPALVVPNGIAADAQTFIPPSGRRSEDVLFIGSYFWPPNIKAARFLAREVLPRIWATRPTARLVLCGRSPGVEVAFLRNARVAVTGTVPDVRPYLDRAAVYANALFEGGGSSLKVLEPLACGIPLVSTAVGVRGFPLVAGEHYLPADNPDEFAAAILQVFDHRDSFDEQAGRARQVAEAHDWASSAERFAELVSNVARTGYG